MKASKILGFTIFAFVLFSAVSIEAAREKSRAVLVPYDGTVAGTHLASGKYQVKCETSGESAKLTFLLDRKVVATVEGQVVNRAEKYSDSQVIYDTKSDGTRTITEIRLAKPSQVVVFNE
ncbi:MAG TPA: hypothetical protein VNM47_15795 [Terriglobia bacterium]|nr:hypothetical protein [Terriglobia bacterium]